MQLVGLALKNAQNKHINHNNDTNKTTLLKSLLTRQKQ